MMISSGKETACFYKSLTLCVQEITLATNRANAMSLQLAATNTSLGVCLYG